jgi:hypothetical protein
MDFNKLSKGERIVLIAGVLLVIDLLFLPWHRIKVGGGLLGVSLDVSRTGVQSPHQVWGILALLVTLVMIAQIVAARFTSAQLPKPPVPWGRVHLIAGVVVLALLVIKLLAETSFLGFGCFLGIILGAALAFGGFTISTEPEVSPGLMP